MATEPECEAAWHFCGLNPQALIRTVVPSCWTLVLHHLANWPILTSSAVLQPLAFFSLLRPSVLERRQAWNSRHVSWRWYHSLRDWFWPWHTRARPCLRIRTVCQKRTMSRVVNPIEPPFLVARTTRRSSMMPLPDLFFSVDRSPSIYVPLPPSLPYVQAEHLLRYRCSPFLFSFHVSRHPRARRI